MEQTQTRRLSSTAALLDRVRDGDQQAKEQLAQIYLPLLRKWAHGRLPEYARGLAETDDLVQETLISALGRVDDFEARREGAFLAYLRQILVNAVRREIRRPQSRHQHQRAESEPPEPQLQDRITPDAKSLMDYENALARLRPEAREAVILRLEFGLTFGEIAAAMRKPSANAARMAVSRALVSLAECLQ